ncbi:hypothetical protein GE253_15770 [Niveispirillum sp. SYP-B3756]|uniref:hypothetical protein n=1 Tax=Niveispirillum sp. SYP-B3756 TaxID=2662178 RepID=UPI001291C473|nr:hypothetical protein [Niveispirillum sp. SYP-B3756]MQP66791.1 hypothetical protein [Niveispirillum sp. SYP-B3756]
MLDSRVRRGIRQGDPTEREVHVYVPAGHEGCARPLGAKASHMVKVGKARWRGGEEIIHQHQNQQRPDHC